MPGQYEYSFEPKDWDTFRQLGHEMMNDMVDYLETLRDRLVWQPIPSEIKNRFKQPLPKSGKSESIVYGEFKEAILPYPLGNAHPRFWGWVIGGGTPSGMLSELLTGAISAQLGGAEHIGTYVELQVLDWLKEIMGFPQNASGILVSGASMANLIGLTVARNTKAHDDVRKVGLQNKGPRMVAYASNQAHSSHQKSSEVLGLGSNSLRFIPADDNYQIQLDKLRETIKADIGDGHHPFCVIGSAGTTGTGAFDDMNVLADICEEYDIWLHVDGAFGALVAFTEQSKHLIDGMQRADSIAFDMHKWVSLPFEAACVLVKHSRAHYDTFALEPDYLAHDTRGASGAEIWFTDYGVQLSRSFRALKVWMALKTLGTEQIGKSIQMNIEQTQYLVSLIEESPVLKLTAPVPLNIVCFRYVQSGKSQDELNLLNKELLLQLHESGIAIVSNKTVNDNYCLRMANVNHRSTYADFDILVKKVIELGNELVKNIQVSKGKTG